MKIRTTVAALAGLLLMALPSFAQITVIEGNVTGSDGKPLQGALIRIERTDVKSIFKVKTDKKGHYLYNGLPLGTYDVVCVVDGKDVDKVGGVHTTTRSDSSAANVAGSAPQPRPARCTSTWPTAASQSSTRRTSNVFCPTSG